MTVRDPVCGMCFEWEEARAFQRVGNAVVYFCCRGCAARFVDAPQRYLDGESSRRHSADPAECPPDSRRRSITSHGIPAAVPLERLPRVGTLRLDEFDDRLRRAWIGPESTGSECRVLARALLSRVLGWRDPHRVSVQIAAEISILRSQCDDLTALLKQLTSLPDAVATTGRNAGLSGIEVARLRRAMAREVADASRWLATTRPSPEWSRTEHQAE